MRKLVLLLILFLAASCSVKERPISYGTDDCDYCKMTIMDHRYGAELVTKKGKVYTFDAAECLIEYLYHNETASQEALFLLVTSYTEPDHLTDAKNATYLVSNKMPSPMGAYLTTFSDQEIATEFHQEKGGNLYTWDELFENFRSIKRGIIEQ